MLSFYNSSDPIAFGHKFKPFVKQGYFGGGSGNFLLINDSTLPFFMINYFFLKAMY